MTFTFLDYFGVTNLDFDHVLVSFGAFWRFWKNKQIQDGE